MANEYVLLSDFKAFIGRTITTNPGDDVLTDHITNASRWVDGKCGRRFYADAIATARVFHPDDCYTVRIDDALAITAVAVDDGDDGNYSTTWAAADYQTLPLNGIGANGRAGWPTTCLEAVESRTFPTGQRRAAVRVTAQWGWTAVPDEVEQATLFYAQRLMYLVDTPGGVTQSVEFGGLPIRRLSDIEALLAPFMTGRSSDGRFLAA
jgi:hypothetical protein